ncbi:MAG: right-handed parallel beta-helix repeat-containing protein, partial [Myxococcota bacterium]
DVNMQATYVGTGMVSLSELFTTRLLDDPIMRKTFVRNLKRIAEEMSEGETTTRVRELEAPLLAILNREFPLRSAMKMDRLERRAIELTTTLRETNLDLYRPALVRPDAEYPDAIHAHLERDALGDYVELVNVIPVPVLVHSLVYATPNSEEIHPLDFNAAEQLPIRLPATPLGMPPTPIKIRYRAATGSGPIQGELQISGQQRRHRFEASAYFAALERHPIAKSSLAQTLEAHPYLVLEPSTGRLRMSSGEQRIDGSLVLPAGIGLELGPGTTLRFEDGEALIASGPLTFLGTPDAPVILAGRDEDTRWSGIIVFRSDESHHWKNVIVRNTSGIERPGWRLTGGVTLREAVVLIEDSRFESNHCEDALNLVRTEFELINVHFSDTPSDAFDGDFSNGRVIGGSFSDIGGDGIDVSGADVTIENVLLTRIHDKAFSIGEGSRAQISGVHVDGAGTALASKDASHTEISDALFENIEFTAIMAYVKKPEYGPAKIIANDIVLREVGREVLVQIGSQLTLNGVEIMAEDVDVDSLYKGGYMKK